ncbi:hypothetical protein WICPIJ_003110 [Wickerhamomyces pijperi]|uniref:Autophagy-related protein 13 n=1 Tax=Wickerhamomyces pijperi TaxID=599730 RepID=A0A9P8QA80_WICPI|nr:hypothetical protein WICPIJ_003110 [Wickerhamomyces pijperi]
MSSQNKKEKLLQIVHNFFLKSATVISQSRSLIPNDHTQNQRVNKWFNLETYDTVKDDLKLWKSSSQSLPPMIIETYLDLREFKPNQSLVLLDDDNIEWPVNTRKSEIVIERWLIELDVNIMDSYDEELPILYKKLIITFRYLYALSRLLPSYKLLHMLENNSFTKTPLRVGTRILDGNRSILSKGRIGLSKPIISSSKDHLTQRMFTPIATSMGLLKISVSYRNDVRFQINETEQTLSILFSNIDDSSTSSSSKPPSSNIRKVFKSGTVSPPCTSPNLTRNESNASIAQNLKIQRTGSTGVAAPQSQTQPLPTSSIPRSIPSSLNSNQGFPVELSSSGGTPKYSSSFGRNTRRSSLRRSSSIDKNTPGGSSSIDDNLKDFVKMMDSKQDLRLNYNPNIQDSLGRFQMMRSRNDLLSESMTASLYSKSTSPPIGTGSNTGGGPGTQADTGTSLIPIQQSHSYQQRLQRPNSRSPSHSPNTRLGLSISPRHYLPLISSRLSGGNPSNESLLLDERRYSSPIEEDQAESDINEDQQSPPMKITSMPISRITSTSPSSLNNIMPRMSFSVGPSNPTIAATQTHAKLHKPQSSDSSNTPNSPQLTTNSAGSKVRTNSTSGRCTNPNIVLSVGPEHHWQRHGHGHGHGHGHSGSGTGAAEDDDLLFTMSDMNLK